MASGGTLEAVNQLVERLEAPVWLALAVIVGGALAGSTVFWVGAADLIALAGAGIGTCSGIAAAWWRRQLDHLPLELSEQAAVWDGLAGARITVRARLGRGRRVERCRVTATMDDQSLPVIVHPGPAVGRFQAVVTGLPAWHAARDLEVAVEVQEGARTWTAARSYAPVDRKVGRFSRDVRVRGGVWFDREGWDRLGN